MEDDGLNIANLDTTNNSSQNREFLNKIKPGAIAGWHKYKNTPLYYRSSRNT